MEQTLLIDNRPLFLSQIFHEKHALYEHNYVAGLCNQGDDQEKYNSFLYVSGGMSEADVRAVKDLLEGKKVSTKRMPKGYYIIKV